LRELHLESSVTAEPFYSALGYSVDNCGDLRIASGVPMPAVAMRKEL
jgi:hypothetical protein